MVTHKNFSPGELEESLLHVYRSIYTPESYRDRARYFREIYQNLVSTA